MYRALIAAARVRGMLDHPSVLTASRWQDWLHPRGKDGKFIQKASFVNIFADPSSSTTDRSAVRRRAKIEDLTPEGARVTYYEANASKALGKLVQVPADPEAGFPEVIPVAELGDKVSSAPTAIAHLHPQASTDEEFHADYTPAMTQAQYDAEIERVNQVNREAYAEQAQLIASGQGPISDEDFQAHSKFITTVNQQIAFRPPTPDRVTGETAPHAGQSLTYDAAFKDSHGLWSDEIQEKFDQLVDEVFNEVTDNQTKPKNRRAIMLGGLPGAGKSSTLAAMHDARVFHGADWIIVNPDSIKDAMLERGMFPKIDGLAPAETASFIHEASSEMNHWLETLLTHEGYNVIFDVTMGGRADREGGKTWTEKHLDSLKELGYTTDGIFVDVQAATSRARVQKRHQDGLNALRTGQAVDYKGDPNPDDPAIKFGGRSVPDAVISENEVKDGDPNAQDFNSIPAVNFNRVKGQFSRWVVWDNGGDQPEFTGGTASGVADKENMPGYFPSTTPDGPAANEETLL